MAELNEEIKLTVTEVRIIFFPLARYCRSGDMAIVTVWGIPVYKRVGNRRKILLWML